jgi:ketosteroid isomerase-like protein
MVASDLWPTGIDETAAVGSLHDLNAQSMRAFGEGDAGWYWEHLSDDFVCTLVDGRRVGRDEFLDFRREAPSRGLTYDEVDVRLLGDTALVQGVMHASSDGECEFTRYTHVWRRRWGAWHVVAAHLTRVETEPRLAKPGRGRRRVRRQP